VPTVTGVDRSYVRQGKDPETALRLSDRPNADWIRLLIDAYASIASDGRRQVTVSGDRLFVHAKADEVAGTLLPTVLAAVGRANDRYPAFVDERADRAPVDLAGDEGRAIASAFDAIDAAIADGAAP
jgi:hypothetical protein